MKNAVQLIRELDQTTFSQIIEGLRANADKQTVGICFNRNGCMCAAGVILHVIGGQTYDSFMFDTKIPSDYLAEIFGAPDDNYHIYEFIYTLNDVLKLDFYDIATLLTDIRLSTFPVEGDPRGEINLDGTTIDPTFAGDPLAVAIHRYFNP